MDFPIIELLDEDACYQRLVHLLHPSGMACPRCGEAEELNVHRRDRAPVLIYRCGHCRRIFNTYAGTPLQGTQRGCRELLMILRGVCQGTPTARLARELGCDRKHLLEFRHQIQGLAEAAAGNRLPLEDGELESDEMYQNAGEKRYPASGPR